MEQDSINQRLKFLAENLAESARAFSDVLDESPTNTHNYISGGRKPAPEYLKKVLLHFRNVNAHWLITGEGEPLVSGNSEPSLVFKRPTQNQKKNKGHIINHTGNGPTSYTLDECQRDRERLQATCEAHEREIALLKKSVADKEEIIQLLKQTKP